MCSNKFHVADETAFMEWINGYELGWEVLVHVIEQYDDGSADVVIGGDDQYPQPWPKNRASTKAEHDDENLVEWDVFARELAAHLGKDATAYIVAGGNEKCRYAGISELAVTRERMAMRMAYSNDPLAAERLLEEEGGPITDEGDEGTQT